MEKLEKNPGWFIPVWRAVLILFFLTMPAYSCSTPVVEDPAIKETQQAVFVQATMAEMNAASVSTQSAAVAATAAQIALLQQQFAQATIQAQETIIAGQIAALQPVEPTPPPEPVQAPEALPPASLAEAAEPAAAAPAESIVITNWKMSRFAQINSGCHFPDQVCWKGDDKYTFEQSGIINLVLTSREPILIDPTWTNPHLVFWHKYTIPRYATVSINAEGRWSLMATFTGNQEWKLTAIPLSLFSEKTITIQFLAEGKPFAYDPKADWYLQDIKIVPDYIPFQ